MFVLLAAASVIAGFEGERLAALVAAMWAFSVMFDGARRRVHGGGRA